MGLCQPNLSISGPFLGWALFLGYFLRLKNPNWNLDRLNPFKPGSIELTRPRDFLYIFDRKRDDAHNSSYKFI